LRAPGGGGGGGEKVGGGETGGGGGGGGRKWQREGGQGGGGGGGGGEGGGGGGGKRKGKGKKGKKGHGQAGPIFFGVVFFPPDHRGPPPGPSTVFSGRGRGPAVWRGDFFFNFFMDPGAGKLPPLGGNKKKKKTRGPLGFPGCGILFLSAEFWGFFSLGFVGMNKTGRFSTRKFFFQGIGIDLFHVRFRPFRPPRICTVFFLRVIFFLKEFLGLGYFFLLPGGRGEGGEGGILFWFCGGGGVSTNHFFSLVLRGGGPPKKADQDLAGPKKQKKGRGGLKYYVDKEKTQKNQMGPFGKRGRNEMPQHLILHT